MEELFCIIQLYDYVRLVLYDESSYKETNIMNTWKSFHEKPYCREIENILFQDTGLSEKRIRVFQYYSEIIDKLSEVVNKERNIRNRDIYTLLFFIDNLYAYKFEGTEELQKKILRDVENLFYVHNGCKEVSV